MPTWPWDMQQPFHAHCFCCIKWQPETYGPGTDTSEVCWLPERSPFSYHLQGWHVSTTYLLASMQPRRGVIVNCDFRIVPVFLHLLQLCCNFQPETGSPTKGIQLRVFWNDAKRLNLQIFKFYCNAQVLGHPWAAWARSQACPLAGSTRQRGSSARL